MNAITKNKLQDIFNFLLSLVSSTSFQTTPFLQQKKRHRLRSSCARRVRRIGSGGLRWVSVYPSCHHFYVW